jgi:hypothetical protein
MQCGQDCGVACPGQPRVVSTQLCQSYRTVTGLHIIGNGVAAARTTDTLTNDKSSNPPLYGVRVLELGQLIAGPFTGQLLGCV